MKRIYHELWHIHAMKIVEKVHDKRLRKVVTIDDINFDLCQVRVQLMQYLF